MMGCDSNQQNAIKQAHEDAVTMAELVKTIDFGNDPGALDYLGPSALNKDWQGNIQSVFEHISTFRLSGIWPGYKMNARCGAANDAKYQNRCSRPGVIAYQWNTKKDAKDPNTAPKYNQADAVSNMHFCDQFFNFPKLDEAVDNTKNNDNFKRRYDVTNYKNQAYIVLHEFMHATVMTFKQNNNRRIVDMTIFVYEYVPHKGDKGYDRKVVKWDVYQPLACKVLARTSRQYIVQDGITMNGILTPRKAKYVQSKLDGNQYPWLPLADREAIEWHPKLSALLLPTSNGTFGINVDELSADGFTTNDDGSYVAHDLDDSEIITLPNQVDTDTLVPESDYPSKYNSQLQEFSTYVNTPDPTCAKSGSSSPSGRSAFSASEADAKIQEFCNDKNLYNHVFAPPIDQGCGKTKNGKGKALGGSGNYKINGGKDNLWIGAYFASGSCVGMDTWPPTGEGLRDTDLCLDRLRAIISGCDTSTTDQKYGGSLQEVCMVYQIMAVGSGEPDPTGVVSPGDHGKVTCKDTDTSILGDSYKNTCTCWFEKLPGQTDIFGMPESGGCGSIDYLPAWTYQEDPTYKPADIKPVATITASG
ncbi:hypothetical protein F1880_001727 [Penicillium rolfsii]|nr:hypothetical protein F1880_001727 [Penicillium rolfsii]